MRTRHRVLLPATATPVSLVRAWHAKGTEDDFRMAGNLHAGVDLPIGSTHTGQPGPWINSTFSVATGRGRI